MKGVFLLVIIYAFREERMRENKTIVKGNEGIGGLENKKIFLLILNKDFNLKINLANKNLLFNDLLDILFFPLKEKSILIVI